MGFLKLLALSLLSLNAVCGAIEVEQMHEIEEEVTAPTTSPNLAVQISASFPHAEVFGVKLINGKATEAVLSITNSEPAPITVAAIGGSLWRIGVADQPPVIVRNFTASRYNIQVPAGEQETMTWSFKTELHPQDLLLTIGAAVATSEGNLYQIPAFNGTVSVVEAPTSIFDPQIIFLYLILAGMFAGTSFYIYNTWIASLLGQQNKRRAPLDKSSRVRSTKRPEVEEPELVTGEDGAAAAATTGAKTYDASWIPEHHTKRPAPRKIRSGTPSSAKPKTRAA